MGQKDVCLVQFMLDSLYTKDPVSSHCIRIMLRGLLAKKDDNKAG